MSANNDHNKKISKAHLQGSQLEDQNHSHEHESDSSQLQPLLNGKPHDRFMLVGLGFAVLGMTSLLPWNFFITATDYWMYKFRNSSLPYNPEEHTLDKTPMQVFFESYLSIAANLPMLFSMILNAFYGQRFSVKFRLYSTLTTMFAVFVLTTIFVPIDTDDLQWVFFLMTMFLVVIINFTSAVFQASIFGLVASFPAHHMHFLVTGQALAGLLAVTIQILSMLDHTSSVVSGLYYFLSSTAFIGFALVCFWLMTKNRYARFYLAAAPKQTGIRTIENHSEDNSTHYPETTVTLLNSRDEVSKILKNNWQLSASLIMVFWATLAVFPGICVLIHPQNPNVSPISGRFYTPLTTFLLYNCGDLAGRLCSSYLPFPVHLKKNLLVITLIRSILPFLIIFCNVHPKANTPVLFENDFAFPILNSLTSLTNGYIFSSAMVMAAASSPKEHQELTGFIMTSSLGLGLTLGSLSSNILLRII